MKKNKKIIGIQSAKRYNRLRIIYLLLIVPFLLFILAYLGILASGIGIAFEDLYGGAYEITPIIPSFMLTFTITLILIPIYIFFMIIGYFTQKRMILNLGGMLKISRDKYDRLYNIVENLCISRGMMLPHILIMKDDSLNSFSIGWGEYNTYIGFSMGIFDKLTDAEIEAMAAHELSHILNGDSRVMFLTNLIVFPFLKFKGSIHKGNSAAVLFLFPVFILGEILLLMVNLSISRRKEYLADIGSIELSKNREGLISTIKKVSKDPRIELPIVFNSATSSMFFYDPKKESFLFGSIFSSHPTISDRIQMINEYYK